MSLRQVNAALLTVTGATAASGGRDDWDNPGADAPGAGAGAAKFDGELDAYYREKTDRRAGANGTDVEVSRVLWLTAADARPLGLDTDDVITFRGPDGEEHTGRAIAVAISELPGASDAVQTARIDLELA